MLSVRRGIAADELQGAMSLYGENRAGVPTREGMSVSVRLRRVEQQDMVGIGKHDLAPVRAPKHTPAHEHDAVRRVRLFTAVGRYMGLATEIDDGDAERFEQHLARVRRAELLTRKNLQAGGVHTRNTRGGCAAPLGTGGAREFGKEGPPWGLGEGFFARGPSPCQERSSWPGDKAPPTKKGGGGGGPPPAAT